MPEDRPVWKLHEEAGQRITEHVAEHEHASPSVTPNASRLQLEYREQSNSHLFIPADLSMSKAATNLLIAFLILVIVMLLIAAFTMANALSIFLSWQSSAVLGASGDSVDAWMRARQNKDLLAMFALLGVIVLGIAGVLWFRRPRTVRMENASIGLLNAVGIPLGAPIRLHKVVQANVARTSASGAIQTKIEFSDERGDKLTLSVNALSDAARQIIASELQQALPDIPGKQDCVAALRSQDEVAYTELWLSALSCAPKSAIAQPVQPGDVLRQGRYQILRFLGAGGQGSVYIAKDGTTAQEVIVKEMILPAHVDVEITRTAVKSFENEARILSCLERDDFVRMLDFFSEHNRTFLVLEYIRGQNLKEFVESNGPLAEPEVARLAEQMCNMLDYLHSLTPPVVHRDFTPDNLMLGENAKLRLIDFNVARQSELKVQSTIVGKAAYVAPEQFRGFPTTQSDIYSLGCTLFFLLTGRAPEAISTSHPRSVNPIISQAMDVIVSKATALEQEDRYASAGELLADIKKLVHEESLS